MTPNKNIEVSKSWFVLAQIVAVIAGLFVFAGGFLIISPDNLVGMTQDLYSFCEKSTSGEFAFDWNMTFEACVEMMVESLNFEETSNIGEFLVTLGFILVLNTLILWLIGRRKLEVEDFPDKKFGLALLLIDIILIVIILANSLYLRVGVL